MIVTGEGYLVGLSLVLPLRHPLEYKNPGAVLGSLFGPMNGMIPGISIGNNIV